MASTWLPSLQQGLAANRPTVPDNARGTLAFYYATDTGVFSAYVGNTWTIEEDNNGDGSWVAFGGNPVVSKSTFAGLPASPVEGQLAVVTDGDSASYANGAVIAGGGSTVILALYNGSAWVAA